MSSSQVSTINTPTTSRIVTGSVATKVMSSSATTVSGQKILIQGRSVTVVPPSKQNIQQSKMLTLNQSSNKQNTYSKIQQPQQQQQGTSTKRIVPLETYIANNPGNAQKILAIVKSKTENLTGESKTQKITTITHSQLSQLQASTGNRNSSLVVLPKNFQNTMTTIKKVEDLSDSISVDEEENQGDEIENKDDNDGKS